ncbi:uncharacterized protein [Henckelia pumila]|uniref:uncharacterized protein n=1 Tax=Henckelia pumila TaxID=405737 RepID=UPI003C6DF540
MKMRGDNTSFNQHDQESLYEAWERFKELLRKCPHHELPPWLVVQTFYYGLFTVNRSSIDAAACGNLLRKTPEEGYELLEEMASSSYQAHNERSIPRKTQGVHQVDSFTAISAQLEVMNRKIDSLSEGAAAMRIQEVFCDTCGGEHFTKDCQTDNHFYVQGGAPVQQGGNQNRPRNNPYSNSYNPGWRNHPNFSWGGTSNQARPQGNPQYGKKPIYNHEPKEEKSELEKMMMKFIFSTETRLQNQDSSIKNIENQVGKLARMISSREPGTLPSDTEKNPKDQVLAVSLRSGKVLEVKVEQPNIENKIEDSVETQGKSLNTTQAPTTSSKIVIPPPFPAALKRAKIDAQFGKFLDIFRKLHINIPFTEALMHMPSYAKFLKEILSSKRKIEEHAMVSLTENCSAIVQNKMQPKLKDPGSFSIPCEIGSINFHKALCDLGASINLMPFSVFRKLGLGEPKPTRMSLQLADRSIKYPRGIIEDVLVKVDKFIFPVDFVVLDMEEDLDMPLILGRPFLATGQALIDVQKGKLILRVGDEKITFDVFNALKHSCHDQDCFRIDALDALLCDFVFEDIKDPVEAVLTSGRCEDDFDEDKQEIVAYLNENPPSRTRGKFKLEELGDRRDPSKNHQFLN